MKMRKVKFHVRKGDTVKIIAGNDRGKVSKVLEVDREKYRAYVENAHMVTKHVKPSAENPEGGIQRKEASIHLSNLMLVDPSTGDATRIGRKKNPDDKLQRYSKKSGEFIKVSMKTLSCIILYNLSTYVISQPLPLDTELLSFECGTCPGFSYSEGIGNEASGFTNTYLKSSDQVCRYAPINTTDGDPRTAWAEGVKGSGIGAEIIIPKVLDVNKPVEIWAGYGKSEALFYANNRPKKVLVSILKARPWGDWIDAHDMSGCSWGYGDFQTVASSTIHLKDINGYQELRLPNFIVERYKDLPESYYSMDGTDRYYYEESIKGGGKPMEETFWDHAYFLKLEILEVYEGDKYNDTCISEIRN